MSLLGSIIPLLLSILAVFFIPCLIVGLWRKRPVLSFILASLVMFITLVVPTIIKTLQAMVIYGEGDPQLVAGLISQAIVAVILSLVIYLPLLFLFQWFILRRHRRKNPTVDADKTFSWGWNKARHCKIYSCNPSPVISSYEHGIYWYVLWWITRTSLVMTEEGVTLALSPSSKWHRPTYLNRSLACGD